MERNSWDTAIRCLEVALHPNTSDEEVLAAINGYRRTAGGASLADLARKGAPAANPGELQAEYERLNRENLDLRRMLMRRVDESEQRLCDLSEELLAARSRASLAEQLLAELRVAHVEITAGLRDEIRGLRDRASTDRPSMRGPFREVLAAASARSPWTA